MAKLLVIVGITGNQGSSVYNVFKHEKDWRIRGLTRDPSKPSCKFLLDAGVELVKTDLDDPSTIERGFEGANAIYALTDYFQHMFADPSTFVEAEKKGVKPAQVAMEREIVHGKNIIRAAAKQLATLDRMVFSTLSDARKWSKGEITENYHFDGTASCTQFLKDEFPALAERTSYLQLGNYLSNWEYLIPIMFQKQSDGSMLLQYHLFPNSTPQPFVDARHDTGHFARALLLSAPAGTTMSGYRDVPMTIEEYAALWGKVNNMKVTFRHYTSEDAVAAGLPEWLASELLVGGEYQSRFGCSGGDPEVKTPEECGVDVSKLGTVEEWMRKEDWSRVL